MFTTSIKAMLALGLSATAITIAACGGEDTSGTATVSSTAAGSDQLGSSSEANASGPSFPDGGEPVQLDPKEFTTAIDNPYWPMSPGSKWVYRETDTEGTEEKVVVEVTDETKVIANGIEARVVRDTVTEHGVPVEVTDDWYAQDSEGNIWYLGEATQEYVNGKPGTTKGSFEAGVDGAQAGIALPGSPEPGQDYRQEFLAGEAEDEGAVVTVGEEQVEIPFGHFTGVLMTRDLVPTEPKVQELKFYAPGVGPLLSVHIDGAGGRAELVSYTPGS